MKFLADEGVDKPIVDQLRISGFDVHYVLETHRGSDDDTVLQLANDESRIDFVLQEYGEKLDNAFTVIQANAVRIRKQEQ